MDDSYWVIAPGTRVGTTGSDGWPLQGLSGWMWPTKFAYKIQYPDGSVGYYPEWDEIPARILFQMERGGREGYEVTILSWRDESSREGEGS